MSTGGAFLNAAKWEVVKVAASYYTGGGAGWVSSLAVDKESSQSVAEAVGNVVGDSVEVRNDFLEAIKDGDPLADNPWCVANGIEGSSPQTQWYYRKQDWIKKGSTTASTMGKVGSWFTGWNVSDLAQHGSGAYNVRIELQKLSALATKLPRGGTLEAKINHVVKLKNLKMATRGGSLAAATVPVVGQFIGAASNIAKATVVAYWDAATTATAAALHWQAYREGVLLGSRQGTGPAIRIIEQLFEDYTMLGWAFAESKVQIRQIIAEPQGWLVVSNKMNAI